MYPKILSPLADGWGPTNKCSGCRGLWRGVSNYAHLNVAEENDKTTGKQRSLHCLPFPNLIPNWAYITQCLHQNILAKTSSHDRIAQLNTACLFTPLILESVGMGGPSIPNTITTQNCSDIFPTYNLCSKHLHPFMLMLTPSHEAKRLSDTVGGQRLGVEWIWKWMTRKERRGKKGKYGFLKSNSELRAYPQAVDSITDDSTRDWQVKLNRRGEGWCEHCNSEVIRSSTALWDGNDISYHKNSQYNYAFTSEMFLQLY